MKTRGTLFQIGLLGVGLLMLPAAVKAQFSWTTNSGTITITAYSGTSSTLAIPDNITGLPVTAIGFQAFFGNDFLVNVTTGTNLTSIGAEAFQSCDNLTSFVIGTNVSSIGTQAFYNCQELPGITLPASVTSVGTYAFANCTKLTQILVAPSNPDFSSVDGVLFNAGLTTLLAYPGGLAGAYTIPSSVTTIGESAFWDCINLTGITFPSSVTTIEEDTFDYCARLTNVVIGSGVTSVGDDAFDDCQNLDNITIPASVTSIGEPLCYGCPDLTNIVVSAANPEYVSVGGVLFNLNQTQLLQFPGGLAGTYIVTNSITSIAYEAFAGCPGLTTVFLPASVASVGTLAFSSCSDLTKVLFQGNEPTPGNEIFDDANAAGKVYYFAGTAGWSSTYSEWPTVALNSPLILSTGIGLHNHEFGFTVIGTNMQTFVTEAATNLLNANWQPIQTNTITAATFTFNDLQWTNFPIRFYFIAPMP